MSNNKEILNKLLKIAQNQQKIITKLAQTEQSVEEKQKSWLETFATQFSTDMSKILNPQKVLSTTLTPATGYEKEENPPVVNMLINTSGLPAKYTTNPKDLDTVIRRLLNNVAPTLSAKDVVVQINGKTQYKNGASIYGK